ncbi:hypothetical protein [Rhizobium sp. BK176]|uniref:hypothetical protein n=1 Tax=Rhizobium sp. BK176 TaxID=2587071 RepID=UPI00216932E5|nr:hypothetical protein [Rhizobium sp. BK176]MCS4088827.1 hypothetical protein [Rhizobium sp. BK176]
MMTLKSLILAAVLAASSHCASASDSYKTRTLPENVESVDDGFIAKPVTDGYSRRATALYEWNILIEDLRAREFTEGCTFNGFDGTAYSCLKADPYRAVLDEKNNLTLYKKEDGAMVRLDYWTHDGYRLTHLVDFNDVRAAFKLPPYPPVQKSGS